MYTGVESFFNSDNLGYNQANFSYNAKNLSGEALRPETNRFLTKQGAITELKHQRNPVFEFQKYIALVVKKQTAGFDRAMGDTWRVPAYQIVEHKKIGIKKFFSNFKIKMPRFLH